MSPLEWCGVLVAGTGAGAINTLVGSGTLITFPTLLAFGVPPVSANMSNAIGLVPGSMSGAWGYRRELAGQRARILGLASATVLGSVAGALLLLVLPSKAFEAIVPVLVGLGIVLVLAGPRISAWVRRRNGETHDHDARWLWPAVFGTGVYCGYFGAAQGIILMAVLGIGAQISLQRANGVKNVLTAVGNGVAGIVFVLVAPHEVDWAIVLVIGTGAAIGALVAARYGRRLPDPALRWIIAVVGTIALLSFMLG